MRTIAILLSILIVLSLIPIVSSIPEVKSAVRTVDITVDYTVKKIGITLYEGSYTYTLEDTLMTDNEIYDMVEVKVREIAIEKGVNPDWVTYKCSIEVLESLVTIAESLDKRASLAMSEETTLRDATGESVDPVTSVTITSTSDLPEVAPSNAIWSMEKAYNFELSGARFDKTVEISIYFDEIVEYKVFEGAELFETLLAVPASDLSGEPMAEEELLAELFEMEKDLLFEIIEELKVELASEEETEGEEKIVSIFLEIHTYEDDEWKALDTTVDWDKNKATTRVDHFSVFALLAVPKVVVIPTIESTPIEKDLFVYYAIFGVLIAGVGIAVICMAVRYVKKKNK